MQTDKEIIRIDMDDWILSGGGGNETAQYMMTLYMDGTQDSVLLSVRLNADCPVIQMLPSDKSSASLKTAKLTNANLDALNGFNALYYTTQQSLDKADVLQTFGSDNAVITDLVLSSDHLTTYVAFYEPDQDGLNGSVHVIDTDTGEILEKYDNVCYRPTRMIYKQK